MCGVVRGGGAAWRGRRLPACRPALNPLPPLTPPLPSSLPSLAPPQLMDMFVEQTHAVESSSERPMRFTDSRVDEQDRGISLKSVPMSLVLEGGNGKSYVMNLMDTPGEHHRGGGEEGGGGGGGG